MFLSSLLHDDPFCLVSIGQNSSSQPPSISFECSRPVPGGLRGMTINKKLGLIFRHAIDGKAYEDMKPPEKSEGCGTADMGHCGNKRGSLAECRCTVLDRINEPLIRDAFENDVIDRILAHQKIQQSLLSESPFVFNLTIFCSGRLLGEEILLFKLLNALINKNVSGKINLFLIDRNEYTRPIALKDPFRALAEHPYLDQFLRELCEVLPPFLTVNGAFFAESDHYIAQAQSNSSFKHDLLIGADIGNTLSSLRAIATQAGIKPEESSIVLLKNQDRPIICRMNPFGLSCYNPLNIESTTSSLPVELPSTPASIIPSQHSSGPSTEQWVSVALVIALLGVVGFVVSQAGKR